MALACPASYPDYTIDGTLRLFGHYDRYGITGNRTFSAGCWAARSPHSATNFNDSLRA